MPHKRNPIPQREPLRPRAPVARRTRRPALENVALWHERDISHSCVERVVAARRDDPRDSCSTARAAWSRASSSIRAAEGEPRPRRGALLLRGGAARAGRGRHGAPGGVRDGPAQRTRRRSKRRERQRGAEHVNALPGRFRETARPGRRHGGTPRRQGGARRLLQSQAPPLRPAHPEIPGCDPRRTPMTRSPRYRAQEP